MPCLSGEGAPRWKTEIRRHAIGNVLPCVSAIITAIQPPVILEIETLRIGGITADLVNALTKLRILFRKKIGAHTPVARLPGSTAIVRAITTCRGDGDDHALLICGMRNDRVQAHSAATGYPLGTMRMFQHAFHGAPVFSAVMRLEEGG